jgi:prevent-host-death family protein
LTGHQFCPIFGYREKAVKKTMGAAEFKEKCLAVLDRVGPDGVVITKHGRPVAKLIPIEAGFADLIGSLRGRLRIKGDVLSTGARWDAQS